MFAMTQLAAPADAREKAGKKCMALLKKCSKECAKKEKLFNKAEDKKKSENDAKKAEGGANNDPNQNKKDSGGNDLATRSLHLEKKRSYPPVL